MYMFRTFLPFAARALVLSCLLAVLGGCTPLSIYDLSLDGDAKPDGNTIPGLVSFAPVENKPRRVVVFGIHGMGDTEPCYGNTVADMLAGRDLGLGDTAQSCMIDHGRSMPVCLTDTFLLTGEGLGERGEKPRTIGDECAASGNTYTLDDLLGRSGSKADRGTREMARFGTLTYHRVETRLKTAHGVRTLEIDYYAYWWDGDAKELQLPHLSRDASPESARERVAFNDMLKQVLMDQGLADAALYAGAFGAVMRDGTRQALCLMIRDLRAMDDHDGAPPPSLSTANPCAGLGKGDIAAAFKDRAVVLLAQSLGSRILFDSLSGMQKERDLETYTAKLFDDTVTNAKLIADQIVAAGPLVYMSANQLPLLALSQVKVDPAQAVRSTKEDTAGKEADFFSRLTNVEPDAGRAMFDPASARPARLVAFYDPNDMLGYRAGDHLTTDRQKGIYEVTQRYAAPYFFIAMPQNAHDKSFSNERGRRIVMCGAQRLANDRLRLAPECRTGR